MRRNRAANALPNGQIYAAFVEEYPDVRPEDIPQQVWEWAQQEGSLVSAYRKWEIAELRDELAALDVEGHAVDGSHLHLAHAVHLAHVAKLHERHVALLPSARIPVSLTIHEPTSQRQRQHACPANKFHGSNQRLAACRMQCAGYGKSARFLVLSIPL